MMAKKSTVTAKPRAHERWLVAVYELPLDFDVMVRKKPREKAEREAKRLGEAKKQLRAFARQYGRRVKSFDTIRNGETQRLLVAVFDSRIPQLGVQKRVYRPNKDRDHAIEVSWARAKTSRRKGGAN